MDCLEKDVVARMACSISVRKWDDVWFINKGPGHASGCSENRFRMIMDC